MHHPSPYWLRFLLLCRFLLQHNIPFGAFRDIECTTFVFFFFVFFFFLFFFSVCGGFWVFVRFEKHNVDWFAFDALRSHRSRQCGNGWESAFPIFTFFGKIERRRSESEWQRRRTSKWALVPVRVVSAGNEPSATNISSIPLDRYSNKCGWSVCVRPDRGRHEHTFVR